jgi:hypothetical protein
MDAADDPEDDHWLMDEDEGADAAPPTSAAPPPAAATATAAAVSPAGAEVRTLHARLALNPNKAGLAVADRERVNQIIYEASKANRGDRAQVRPYGSDWCVGVRLGVALL